MDIIFFATATKWRDWLAKHHDTAKEQVVGYYKVGSGKPSLTYVESVREALCHGWIDGIRRRLDDESYSIRFTPRKPGSIWSLINIQHIAELTAEGKLQPAGQRAFEARKQSKSGVYSFEQKEKTPKLEAAHERKFKANKKAWAFFQAQAPWYQRTAAWWVISAKKEETRLKRLATLIDDSAHGRRLAHLNRTPNTDKK